MVSAGVEVVRINCGKYRVWDVPGEGGDEFGVRRLRGACRLRRPSARHQLANCRSNALSLGHGLPPWLGLGPVGSSSFSSACKLGYTKKMAAESTKKVKPKKRGRPATGRDPIMALRVPPALRERVEE